MIVISNPFSALMFVNTFRLFFKVRALWYAADVRNKQLWHLYERDLKEIITQVEP
jgi:hypothetical protein